ncbi:hypothetical protein DPMN_128431 [Dreissena polymorpha]|uniref:Uncharacterized protein n=1 Tax=Dreissena polymorpha TaxID=45954 RepID=A0A9D4H0T6_DREPO|nr:hypothetical protein DPMN_128431 [Dreissena polymorpha]
MSVPPQCQLNNPLQAFLGMFVDDSVTGGNVRRRSATEDDNPPSPIGMDNIDVFSVTQSHQSSGSPGARQRADVCIHGYIHGLHW